MSNIKITGMIKIVFSLVIFLSIGFTQTTTWLSLENSASNKNLITPEQLKLHNIRISPIVVQYTGNKLTQIGRFELDNHGQICKGDLEFGQATWSCNADISPLSDISDAFQVNVIYQLVAGKADSCGIAFVIDFLEWQQDNFLLIPAAAYNGNRFLAKSMDYPPMFYVPGKQLLNIQPIITDVPRLTKGQGRSIIELTTGDAATPAVGIYDPLKKLGVLIFTKQSNHLGNLGIIVEESLDRQKASVVISSPAVREYRAGGTKKVPSDDHGALWTKGDSANLYLQIHIFEAQNLEIFYDRFFRYRKRMSGPNSFRNLIPFNVAMEMQEVFQNEQRWYEAGGYYKNGNGDTPFGHVQIGWVGGLMQTYPLLMCGDEQSIGRSLQTIETAFNNVQGISGFFHGIYKNGSVYGDNMKYKEEYPQIAMVRKNADALYFLLKQYLLLEEKGELDTINPQWKGKTKILADAFVNLWQKYGQFGQLVDVSTGEIVVGGSTSAAMAPAGLALAGHYFNNLLYLEIAESSALFYYENFVKNGYTNGGPGEILQCPDSESAFALLESFVVLYELTGKREWLQRAEEMAKICATWVVSYDYQFPDESHLNKAKARATGSVWASVQNKHAAPGICTASGDCLLKLYRATDEILYLELLKDISHNILEFMSTENRPVGNNKNGYINERVNLSDWEGKWAVGHLHWSSVSWCELSVMLTAIEVPGIYIQRDRGIVYSFDHVDVQTIDKDSDRLIIKIKNPSIYEAKISVLVETSKEAKEPLCWNLFLKMPKIHLYAGESKQYRIDKNGINEIQDGSFE